MNFPKKAFSFLFLFTALLSIAPPVQAQVIVKVRPMAPKVAVRPVMPGRGLVWIEPEWCWNKRLKTYEWREGRWVKPRHRAVWISGHWAELPGGYRWEPGYWGRRK